jgi:hypothetical protein
LRTTWFSVPLLLTAAAPALAEEWVSFPMSEGPDIRVDRSSIRRDTEGSIAAWTKGWKVANTDKGTSSYSAPGYFVTDCGDQYYSFTVNPETKAVQEPDAQPMRVTAGSMAQNIQTLVCGPAQH